METITDVVSTVAGSVVGIGRGWGSGSGVVVADGLALISGWRGPRHGAGPRHRHGPAPAHRGPGHRHGVEHRGGPRRQADPEFATLRDGRRVDVEVAGADPATGLLVVRLDTGGIVPVSAAPADAEVRIGTPVVAFGDPGGRGLRATAGAVASDPRPVPGPRGRDLGTAFEHTAPLPRGASGGPVVDAAGRLLGVSVMRPSPGLILALVTGPDVAARARAVAAGEVAPPRVLGVALAPSHVAGRMRAAVGLPAVEGVLVRAVEEGSAAEAAGLAAGDLVTAAGGAGVRVAGDLARAIDASPPGAPLVLTVVRGTETREVAVDLDAGAGS